MNRFVSSRVVSTICITMLLSLNFTTLLFAFEMNASRPVSIDITQSSATGASLKLELGDLVRQEFINQGERFDRFPIDGQPIAGPAGRPELPALVKLVLIPPESGVSLRVRNLRTHIVQGVNPFPRQPEPLEKDIEDITAYQASLTSAPLVFDEDFYRENRFWPEENVTLGEPQIMRGYRLLPVRVNPLRYNPVTRELEVLDAVDLELDFSSDENRVNLVENPGKLRPSSNVDKLLQRMVVNPPNLPDRDLGTRGGSILYVLGTGQAWNPIMDELTPLIEWRRKMGWTVDVLRLNGIGDAGATRQAIQAYYRDADVPPEHVVICGDANGNMVAGFFDHRAGSPYPYESDHDFGMLEGNDILPEASVGRFIFDSANMLRGIVRKTILYESDPFVGEGNAVGWQTRGAVESVTSRSGLSSNDMCRWSKAMMIQNGYTRVSELYWEQAGADRDNRQFVYDNINGGSSIFLHRGYLWMGTFAFADVDQLRNGRMLPFVMVITCNTGDYSETISSPFYFNERFSYHPDGGAIGSVANAGATHTAYNNIYCTETINSIVNLGPHNQGWAHEAGKMAIYTHYAGRGDIPHEQNQNAEAWNIEFFIVNLMGDPAVDLFTAAPRRLAVTRPQVIRRGETHVEVSVLHDDDDSPALDATVCLYKRGAFQMVRNPDAEGNVVFDLDPAWTERDSIHLTITGHNLLTSRTSYVVGQAADFVGASTYEIDDDDQDGSAGNGDGEANQLETIELTVAIANLGDNDYDGQLTLNLATSDPNLEVIENEVVLDQTPAHGEAAAASFLVRIGGGFPTGGNAVFNLRAAVGENSWNSSVSLPVTGPDLQFVSLDWDDEVLHRAESAELTVTLRNIGSMGVDPFRATFFSRVRTIGPVVAAANFDAIAADETGESQSLFRVSAHPFHIGSRPVPVGLAIEADNGFIDPVLFDLPISDVVAGEPFGPDEYGYICFDNLDTNWFAVPEFNWVEIDPRHDGDGTNTNLRDGAPEEDQSVVVDLPFTASYYGEEFDEITVCSNGWMAMGDCRQLISARNRHIPGGECPSGLIAPFWEDLIIPQGGGVFTWYDEERGQFIVEWSRLKKLGPRGADEPEETFQALLLDPEVHQNFTGDGDIIFQYLDITDNQSAFQVYDTPFASVGIASPDNRTGLEYSYWNERPGGAAALRDELAIRFTTLVEFRTGSLSGRVYDAWTGAPIDSANIYTTFGFSAITDENGEFHIPDMLVDSLYQFTAGKRFYNDSTIGGDEEWEEILEDQETFVEFGLLHPEFSLSAERSDYIMLTDSVANGGITLTNTGNGRLEFTSRYGYEIEGERGLREADGSLPIRDDPDDAWDELRHWGLSDSVDNPRLQCVAFVRDHWLLAATRIGREGPHIFYTFDREGRLTGQFAQPDSVGPSFGIRELEFENGNLWAVATDEFLYQLDPDSGTIINKWWGIRTLSANRCVTRDPSTGYFYIAATTNRIHVVELANDTLLGLIDIFDSRDPRDENESIRRYGFTWFEDDPDGFSLWVIGTNEFPANDPEHPDMAIFKIHPETKEVVFITDLADHIPPAAGGRAGMEINHTWSNRVYALAVIVESAANDWLSIFEIAPNSSWISYEPKSGSLEAGEQTDIEMEIASTGLDTGVFEIMLDYTHTAAPGFQRIPVQMHVVLELPPVDTDTVVVANPDLQPLQFALQAAYPNPFNETTTIRFSLAEAAVTRLRIYDLAGREVAALYDQAMKPGRYATTFGSAGLASGVYICRLESGGRTAVRKMVLMK